MSGRIAKISCTVASIMAMSAMKLALAQQPDEASTSPALDSPALEEIVVTAQKRTERLLDVPMTVDALQGEQLQKLAIYDFQGLSQLSPGLVISNESTRDQTIQMRGISFQDYSGASAGVTVYRNEVEISPTAALRPMFDISQVEVLRGAQGTLRGDTSPAGQITITTKRPALDTFSFDVQQNVGNASQLNTQGGASIPIVEHVLGLRLAGLYDRNDEDGVVNITNGRKNLTQTRAGRATLEFRPSESFDAVLIYQHENADNVTYVPTAGPGNAAAFPLTPDGPALSAGDMQATTPGPNDFQHELDETALLVHWDLGGYRLNYVGSYSDTKDPSEFSFDVNNAVPNPPAGAFSGTYPGLSQRLSTNTTRQYSDELRFESTQGKFWNFMLGAYYAHSASDVDVYQGSDGADTTTTPGAALDSPGAAVVHVVIPETLTTEALFTDNRFQLTSNDLLDVGLRYSRYPVSRDSTLYLGLTPAGLGVPAAFLPFACSFVPGGTPGNGYCNLPAQSGLPDSAKHSNQTGRSGSVSYSHHFNADTMAYVSYARSYRAGGPDVGITANLPANFLTFQPETSDSYEIGLKTNLFNDRLQLFADVFHQKYKNFIGTAQGTIFTENPGAAGTPVCNSGTGSACSAGFTTNGPAETTGFELTARTRFTEHLYTQLNLAYADAHYSDASLYCNDYNNTGVPNASGIPSVQPNKYISTCRTNQSLSPTVGPWQLSANGEYSYPLTSVMEAYLRGLITYSSSAPGDPGAGLAIPATTTVNGFLGLRGTRGLHSWEGFLYVRNLLDSRSFRTSTNEQVVLGVATGYRDIFSMPQREYGLTASYHF